MSASEQTIGSKEKRAPRVAIGNRVLDFLSSVRFGIVLLCVLVVFSLIGMLILQQNVGGFEAYYASLTPAEKSVYAFLDLFDIYNSWYYKLLLLVLSLNIVLASIDRFPSAWSYIVKPKLTATRGWIAAKKLNAERIFPGLEPEAAAEEIGASFKAQGFKTTITETPEAVFVFGESGKWNRLGAYIVHVALLTLFLGHWVALQTGFDADVHMAPGDKTDQIQLIEYNLDKKERFNVQLPFTITCTDIQQKLIDPTGSIDVANTLDWRTQVRIDDPEYGTYLANVSLNSPLTYRGYRFFQAQAIAVGNARTITLALTPAAGGDPISLEIPRNGTSTLPDGTTVAYTDFQPDFTFDQNGQPDTRSGEYKNPAAILKVTPPGGESQRVFAFANKLGDNMPVGAPKLGYKWRLAEFEKVPAAHILSIKYDPFSAAFIAWYVGGFGLVGALMFVFFLSHRRIWARIERVESGSEAVIGAEANRNPNGIEDKFNKFLTTLDTKLAEQQ